MARNSLTIGLSNSILVKSGEVLGNLLPQRLPNIDCRIVKFKALRTNAKPVYIGGYNITIPSGSTAVAVGWPLYPGEETDWFYVDNLIRFEYVAENNTDSIVYFAFD